jgi:hypothetical protein
MNAISPRSACVSYLSLSCVLLFVNFAAPCAAQTREKKTSEKDFPVVVKEASEAFEAKKHSLAIDKLQAALQIAIEALQKEVLAVMPAAPEGFKARAAANEGASNPLATAMLGTLGAPIEQRYDGPKGAYVKITCVAKSPMVSMMGAVFTMAGHDPNKEVIGYGSHKGVLEKQSGGKRFELQVLVAEKHLVTVEASAVSEETLFAMIDQAFIDKLAKILG